MPQDLRHCTVSVEVHQSGRSAPESDYLHGLAKALDEMTAEAKKAASGQPVSQAAG
jgi:hypothetical protein